MLKQSRNASRANRSKTRRMDPFDDSEATKEWLLRQEGADAPVDFAKGFDWAQDGWLQDVLVCRAKICP